MHPDILVIPTIFNWWYIQDDLSSPKVIVFVDYLLKLFTICQIAGCGASIHKEDLTQVYNGGSLTIKGCCYSGHDFIVSS